jgi:hypothetical protein
MATEKYMPWTVVIDVFFLVDFAAILKKHILFPLAPNS